MRFPHRHGCATLRRTPPANLTIKCTTCTANQLKRPLLRGHAVSQLSLLLY